MERKGWLRASSSLVAGLVGLVSSVVSFNRRNLCWNQGGEQDMQVQQQAPQGHIICSGCGTLLMYPEGHPNVRCSICNVVTPTNSGIANHKGLAKCMLSR